MITPLEIREKRFSTRWPGFHKKEVIDFLDSLSIEFQVALRENREIREQLDEERAQKEKLLEREAMIKEVMMAAQSSSDKIRENAVREAELVIRDAEMKAEEILKSTDRQKDQVLQQIQDLRTFYKQFRIKIQSTLDMYGRLLAEAGSEAENDNFGEIEEGKEADFNSRPGGQPFGENPTECTEK
ncbi:MAG: DivIVA domain-containing protein [bacterium]